MLNPKIETIRITKGSAVVGNDSRSFRACCDIQGLPSDFDLPEFNATGKKQVVANAVPLPMADYVAKLINESIYSGVVAEKEIQHLRKCLCGCGRSVVGRAKTAGDACRKRYSRQRKKVTENVPATSQKH